MLLDATPARDRAEGGLVCGAVTVTALGLVFAALSDYQVPDYADPDLSIGLAGGLLGAVVAAGVIAVLRRRRWARGHVVVPLVLLPVAVLPLVAGLERDNGEAVLIWGAAALGVHVLIESRRAAAGGIVLVLLAAGLLTWDSQHRWRARKFEAVGLPLHVPENPGYSLSHTWAGRYTVSMMLKPDDRGAHYVDAVIRENSRCRSGAAEWWVSGDTLGLCLPGEPGVGMTVKPGFRAPDLSPLFDRITVRAVDGSVLADHPDGGEMEPD